ncbi:MAG: tryptophan synthase subunit alpha [Huintestinicola sp.]
MNRIDICFDELKKQNKKALITFVTSGDPDLETTEKTVLEMYDKGADIVELGVPFSDPIAEGPVIQRASLRSLSNGTNLDKIFGIVDNIRKKTDKPLVLMMYLNTLFVYGTEKFFRICSEKGVDGVIVPDMPFEEREEILSAAEKYNVYNINLVAPTSHDRIKMIASESKGFLYCVSSTGVTGMRSGFSTDFDSLFKLIGENASCPYCVGFGISSPEQAKKMSAYCDGVIVGSAIVKLMEEHGRDSAAPVGEFVSALKSALVS